MKTIVLANHKGGCAKTTTALNIAVGLAAQGSRVLAVDLDPQGNLSAVFGVDLEDLEDSRRTSMRLMLDPAGDFSEYVAQARPRVRHTFSIQRVSCQPSVRAHQWAINFRPAHCWIRLAGGTICITALDCCQVNFRARRACFITR